MTTPPKALKQRFASLAEEHSRIIDGSAFFIPESLAPQLELLAGDAGAQGLTEVAELARSLASFQRSQGNHPLNEQDRVQISLLLANLGQHLCPDTCYCRQDAAKISLVAPIAPSVANPNDRVALLLPNPAIQTMLLEVLTRNGFAPFCVESMAELFATREGELAPMAIIADFSACRDDPDTRRVITTLREVVTPAPHLFCLAGADDFGARLEAVRLGATRFLKLPVDTARLLAILRGVTERAPTEPFRVLLVDDDQVMTEYYAEMLISAGIDVRMVNDAFEVPEVLESFHPDVIVIDIYMPGCNGLELAAVLRQDEALADTPILFLSAETSVQRQMMALDLGGDAFLSKPVSPAVFQATILARAKRARMLKRTRKEYHPGVHRMPFLLSQEQVAPQPQMWRFDPINRLLLAPNGNQTRLTAQEAVVVQHLFASSGQHASREALLNVLPDKVEASDGRRLEALISRLRRKTVDSCGIKLPLVPVYGQGYSFNGHVQILPGSNGGEGLEAE